MYLNWFEVKRSEVKWSEVKWKQKNNNSKTETKQMQNINNNKQTETTHTKNLTTRHKRKSIYYIYIYHKRAVSRSGIEPSSFCLPTNNPYLAGLHGSDLFDSLLVWLNAKDYVQGSVDL